jgi:hypothetical protein
MALPARIKNLREFILGDARFANATPGGRTYGHELASGLSPAPASYQR